ncbi:MAG: hypothetical protein F4Z66_07455 [Gammaproteobacteria bacterium]|nr:hypothetical protein [Gammaproteobacteria bacterium]
MAAVNALGHVMAMKNGSAVITAHSGSVSATAAVTVIQSAGSIEIEQSEITFKSIGRTVQLIARIHDGNGRVIPGAAVTWSSGNTAVATVDDNGLVTAIQSGETVITARADSLESTTTITVIQVPGSIVVEPSALTLTSVGENAQLAARIFDENGHAVPDAAVAWSSENKDVATVDVHGVATAVRNGEAVIVARSDSLKTTTTITVIQVAESIVVEPSALTLTSIGDTARLTARVLDGNGHPVAEALVTWSSSDRRVATVNDRGRVRAVDPGDAFVTARSGDTSTTTAVNVSQSVDRVVIDPSVLTLTSIGDTARLTARVLDGNGYTVFDAAVTWSSGNPAVATVDRRGMVTAVKNGEAVITVRSGGEADTAAVTVSQSVSRIVIEPAAATLTSLGETAQFTTRTLDGNGYPVSGAAVTWSSGNPAVADVDRRGLVTAVKNGRARITARAGDAATSAAVTVAQTAVRITITPSVPTIDLPGGTVQLTATVFDQNNAPIDDAPVTWSSEHTDVATVDANGMVTVVWNGYAVSMPVPVITARSGSLETSVTITVRRDPRGGG